MSYFVNNNGMNDGCNYSRFGTYTSSFRGISPPIPTTTVTGYYVVPNYSTPGYDTLTHGTPGGCSESSNGYFKIGRAYGYGANNCAVTYSASLCG